AAAQLLHDPVRSDHAVRPELPAGVERRLAGTALAGAGAARLQPVEHAENLFGTAADGETVHDLVLQDAVGIDEKHAAHRHLLPLQVHAIGPADGPIFVRSEREVQEADPTL